MIEKIGQIETTISWKRGNKSPYYTLHMYVCQLNHIGAIKRTKRGEYDVCFVIPAWLDSEVLWILRGWRDYDYVSRDYSVTETKTKWETYKKSTLVEVSVPSPVPVQNTINIIETPNNNNSNMKELDIKSLLIKYAEKPDIIRFIAEELL